MLNVDLVSDNDISYVVKFDGNGNIMWLKGSSNDGGGICLNVIIVDYNGNVYVIGVVNNLMGIFCGNSIVNGFFILKLNLSGLS